MKEMTRKEFLKLTGASTALLAMSHIIPTSAYADTSKIDAPSAGMYISEVVDLSGLSPVEQEKILTERNIPYDSTITYEKCEFYKDYSWQPNAFLERATIEDTTVTYALVNPKTKRFTSQTAKKTEYRKATHYDNDSYILEKAYYCFEHNLPSYKENA